MIGVQHDARGYHVVSRQEAPFWRLSRRESKPPSEAGIFECHLGVPGDELTQVCKRLLSRSHIKNPASFCLSPETVDRHVFTVPATFSAATTYTWVTQHLESWLGRSQADSYFDYAPSELSLTNSGDGAGLQNQYTLYSVKRSYLDALLLPVNVTRLSVCRVEVPELTLSRAIASALGQNSGYVMKNLMLVDMMPEQTQVYAASSGQFSWLGSIRSPPPEDTESIDVFISSMQRLIVSLSDSPSGLLLAGERQLVGKAKKWVAEVFPQNAIRAIHEVSALPCAALLAASSAID